MATDESMQILLDELDEAETVSELQTSVLAFNKYAEEQFPKGPIEMAGDDGVSDTRIDALLTWMEALQDRMDELADTARIDSYSITVSGSLTGPSVSVGVTCSPSDSSA